MIHFPPDFKEFLQLLHSHQVEYLLVGGYAVGYYGNPRATGDLDIWIAADPVNARRMVAVFQEFGFSKDSVTADLFEHPSQVVRFGVPPLRLDITTAISGVEFAECFSHRVLHVIDAVEVSFISRDDLKLNKKASGRTKDLADLEFL